MLGRTMKQRPRVKRVTAGQRHNRSRSIIILTQSIIKKEFALSGSEQNPDLTGMFRAVDEQESNGPTLAFQPFAAGLQSDPPAPCLQDTALDSSSPADVLFGYLAVSLAELLETAKRELDRDREAAKASLATASSILQSEIERRSRATDARPGALAAWQIARVRAFIDRNLHRTIYNSDLSAVARRSPAHFSRSFKQAFGEPPHAYVVRRRLERACHLMITSSASLSEIALSVCFSDQAHLCRLFRQVFGQSPASWRRDLEPARSS
jgi:AraC family transcriptional regulator